MKFWDLFLNDLLPLFLLLLMVRLLVLIHDACSFASAWLRAHKPEKPAKSTFHLEDEP